MLDATSRRCHTVDVKKLDVDFAVAMLKYLPATAGLGYPSMQQRV